MEASPDGALLRRLIDRADRLRGPQTDPKAALLVSEVRRLVRERFHPVVFCRYIATANYLETVLKKALEQERVQVLCVTGELPSEEREERIQALAELEEGVVPVLVATDCLSEGINLQRHFDGVIHYDLTWNPTRHEQREGRVDRFGQGSPVVRTLMLYGSNNPVDGAVLKVILRKAEKIRKELGVAVPLPMDNTQVIEAVMKAVLLHNPKKGALTPQLSLGFEEVEHEVDVAWEREKDRVSRTVFAQKRLRPDEVLPEWQKTMAFMGGEKDVLRFVRDVSSRLGASLEDKGTYYRFPCTHLPKPLQERLESVGVNGSLKLAFQHPAPTGTDFVPRSHPLVATLADYVAEQALESDRSDPGARCTAFFAEGIKNRTTVYLLRLRCQLSIEKRKKGVFTLDRSLLSEECLGIAVEGGATAPSVLSDDKVLELLSLEAGRNMPEGQKTHLVSQALEALDRLETELEGLAKRRAEALLEDHRRIREASEMRGVRYSVSPALPVDVIGVYVLMPLAGR